MSEDSEAMKIKTKDEILAIVSAGLSEFTYNLAEETRDEEQAKKLREIAQDFAIFSKFFGREIRTSATRAKGFALDGKTVIDTIREVSHHDMPPDVCKGCKESHHYNLCVWDLLVKLELPAFAELIFETNADSENVTTPKKEKL